MKKLLLYSAAACISVAILWFGCRRYVIPTISAVPAARSRTLAVRYCPPGAEDGYRRKYNIDIPHLVTINPGFIPSGENNENIPGLFYVKLEYQVVMRRVANDFPGGPDIAKWELDSVRVYIGDQEFEVR